MSIYDNETKIYPDLIPTAPQEPQTYRLKKLTEIEPFCLDEIEVRERIAKKMKQFNTITGIMDTDLITSAVIAGGISIAAFASGVGMPIGIALSELAYFFPLQQPSHENFLKLSPESRKNTIPLSCLPKAN